MGVILKVLVQDQLHGQIREFFDWPNNDFYGFCRQASLLGARHVDFIWPYADSMLNFFQLAAWLEDFPRILASDVFSPAERASALNVLNAAREAESMDGYLLFEG